MDKPVNRFISFNKIELAIMALSIKALRDQHRNGPQAKLLGRLSDEFDEAWNQLKARELADSLVQ